MSVSTASLATPLTPTEDAAADPGSVAVGVAPLLCVFVEVSAPDPVVALSLFFDAREPRTPPTTAATITISSNGRPMMSHFDFRFGLGE